MPVFFIFFFQAEDGIRDYKVTGVQTCALPICSRYSIPLEDLEPSASIIDSGMRNGHIEVFLSKRQAFWENSALSDEQATKRFIDALLVLKSAATKFTQDEEALFQESARNYRASAVKPRSEEHT